LVINDRWRIVKVESRKQNFIEGIEDKVVVITGASFELREFSLAGAE